jgi:hypothetical protein
MSTRHKNWIYEIAENLTKQLSELFEEEKKEGTEETPKD